MRYYLYGAAGGAVAGLACWWLMGRLAADVRARWGRSMLITLGVCGALALLGLIIWLDQPGERDEED